MQPRAWGMAAGLQPLGSPPVGAVAMHAVRLHACQCACVILAALQHWAACFCVLVHQAQASKLTAFCVAPLVTSVSGACLPIHSALDASTQASPT